MTSVFGVGRTCPPRSLHLGIGRKQFGLRRLPLWLVCVASLLASSASAHDASSYGGVFRSRDLGAAWLNADVGLFLNARSSLRSIHAIRPTCWLAPISES